MWLESESSTSTQLEFSSSRMLGDLVFPSKSLWRSVEDLSVGPPLNSTLQLMRLTVCQSGEEISLGLRES